MKNCRICNIRLMKNTNWYESSVKKKDYICKKCISDRDKEKYKNNKEDIIDKNRQYYEKKKEKGFYNYGERGWASGIIGAYRHSDKKRNHEKCDFDIEEFLEFIKKPCFYCNCDEDQIGADRIDNNKGHTKDNVVPCCSLCNTARMASFSHEEMIIMGKTIKQIKHKRRARCRLVSSMETA